MFLLFLYSISRAVPINKTIPSLAQVPPTAAFALNKVCNAGRDRAPAKSGRGWRQAPAQRESALHGRKSS